MTANCNQCEHRGESHAVGNPLLILTDCRHPKVSGLMGCEHCKGFQLYETFQLVTTKGQPARLRCPADGCRHLQSVPGNADWREGYVGARKLDQDQPAPHWCPGFAFGEPEQAAKTPKAKTLSRKER